MDADIPLRQCAKTLLERSRNAPTTRRGTALRRSAGLIHGMLLQIFRLLTSPSKLTYMSYCADSGSGSFLTIPILFIPCHPKSERGFMQIYTENRFCLPLFYLIVLGLRSLSGSVRTRLSPRAPLPEFTTTSRGRLPKGCPFPDAGGFPRILSGYAFQMPGSRPQRTHDTSRFESRLFAMPLPPNLTPNSSRPRSPSCARPNPILRSFISSYVKRLWNFITFLSRPTRP